MHNKLGFNFGIFLLHLRSIKGKWCVWWCCHWNSVYDFWGRTMVLQGKSNRYEIRFPNLHVILKGQTNVERWHFFLSVKLVTWTTITISRVHNWYSKTLLHMSCSCAESIRNFYFTHCGHMRVKQWRFLPYKASHLNYIYISNVKQMIQWYDLVCLVNLRGKLSMESIKGRKKLCFISQYCNLNSMYISKSGNQMIYSIKMWLGIPCRCPIRFQKLHFVQRRNREIKHKMISITWYNFVFLLCYYKPFEESATLHLNNYGSHLPKDTLRKVSMKLPQLLFSRGFLEVRNVFHFVAIISPWNSARFFMWTNLNSLDPWIFCVKFDWKEANGSEEKKFQKSSIYFLYDAIISP